MKRLCVPLACLLLLLCGCEENVYQLDLRPQGAFMTRELTCWRHERDEEGTPLRSFPPRDLTRIATAYGMAAPASEARKYHFEGVYRRAMPDDVGGAGWHLDLESSLGRGGGYIERFRGDDGIGGRLDRQTDAAERLVDILSGWLASVCGDCADWGRVQAFLEHDLPEDTRNLVFLWILPNLTAPDFAPGQHVDTGVRKQLMTALRARSLQYLLEHGYLEPPDVADAVHLWRLLQDTFGQTGERQLASFANGMLQQRLNLPPGSETGARLNDILESDAPFTSLRAYIQTLPEWQSDVTEWEERRKHDPTAAKPDPLTVLGDLFTPIVASQSAGDPILLTVRLALPVEPVETNGAWNSESGCVEWSTQTDDGRRLPTQCVAWWVVPNEEFQTAHFGSVVLSGTSLMTYVLAENGLSAAERETWNSLLRSLRPESGPAGAVHAFATSPAAMEHGRAPHCFSPICAILGEALEE